MFILSLYSITCTLSLIVYLSKKHHNSILVTALFFVYILDHVVITMTELIPSFAHAYENIFLTVPSVKTLVYAFSFVFMIMLLKADFPKIQHQKLIVPYCIVVILLLLIPILPNSAWKSWFYFFPAQVFLFFYSLTGLSALKNVTEENTLWDYPYLKKLFTIMMLFSIIITLEDTFVIFRVDTYASSTHIFNRNISEDILRILLAIVSIRTTIAYLLLKTKPEEEESTEDAPDSLLVEEEAIPTEELLQSEESTEDAVQDKFKDFCQEYQLTIRESEIFALMIKNMSNQEICDSLLVSLGTVKTHTHNIFSKVEVSRRREAILLYTEYKSQK